MDIRGHRAACVVTEEVRRECYGSKEINSNEESNAGLRQLLMLLPDEITPPQWTRVSQHSNTLGGKSEINSHKPLSCTADQQRAVLQKDRAAALTSPASHVTIPMLDGAKY